MAERGNFRAVNWKQFEIWLLQSHREAVARNIVGYARRYADCLFSMDLSRVVVLRHTLRRHVIGALSNLAKYLGVYEDYKRLLRNYGIGWTGKSVDDLVIQRLLKVRNPDEVWDWVRRVKAERPELSVFMDFMALTGLRFDEAIQSYNLIIRLNKEGRLSEYYNEVNECLEHYRFKEVFIRRTKKAFISFVPKWLVMEICKAQPLKSRGVVQKRVERKGLAVRFSDIRKAHNTVLTRYLTQPEIDFLAGRISANVFMANYFTPALIGDLKERVFKGLTEIQSKL